MNILELVILIVFMVSIWSGLRKGLVRTVASFGTALISLILVYMLNPYVSDFLRNDLPVYEHIEEKCREYTAVEMPENVTTPDSLPIPENIRRILEKGYTAEQDKIEETLSEYLAAGLAEILLTSLSFLLTFLLVSICLFLFFRFLDGIFSLPVLNIFNRLAGGAVGALRALFSVWILFLVAFLFWNTGIGRSITEMAHESSITKWMYDSNLLVFLVAKFFQ